MEDKKQKLCAALACVVFLAGFAWFLCAGRSDVSDVGKRADDTRAGLESAGEEQRDQAAALDRAESAIRDSAERADRVEENERRDAEIIRECQSILATIRGRSEGKD